MTTETMFEIFLVTAPGLESVLAGEVAALGFKNPVTVKGGVTVTGGWTDIWRANLELRGAARVLARIGAFRAFHLAQLDKRARKFPWADVLRPDVPVRVEASCKGSRIYHAGAAAERIGRAIAEELGAPVADDATVCVKARIKDDLCTLSIDSSGEALHRRHHKEAVNKAPMRETLASLFLRQCGFDGVEPVVDPMCGSGSFVIEAAEIAAGLVPGRSRHFAFEQLATFDAGAWQQMREEAAGRSPAERPEDAGPRYFGSDRDQGAVTMSRDNAGRAGVADLTRFTCQTVSALTPPDGVPPGLVIANPPYGERIGETKRLHALYHALGQTLRDRFSGWRAAVITNDAALARATALPFLPSPPPVSHGGLPVRLYRTAALP